MAVRSQDEPPVTDFGASGGSLLLLPVFGYPCLITFLSFFFLNLFIDVCKLKKGTGGIYVTIYVCVCVKFNMPHDVGAIAKPIGRLMTGLADGAPPQASALVAVGS